MSGTALEDHGDAEPPTAPADGSPWPRWRVTKRGFDLVFAGLSLVVLSPAFLAIALAIKLDSPGPVFFRQLRIGAGKRAFRIFKFRTMVSDADDVKRELAHLNKHARSGGDGRLFKIEDDPRVTPIGRLLRRHFLDELPQLINVVRGEMSLVGPRPLIVEEDEHVREWARMRLDLRPGMTGLWQVSGHSDISFDEMMRLDHAYVTTWSFRNDVKLLLGTIPLVVKGDGDRY